jgi:hypothetical protein
MRIPCVVVMENEVRLRIEKVNQSFHVSIFEVWNLPSVLKGWVR